MIRLARALAPYLTFSAIGFVTSVALHNFVYAQERTWFTKHRFAPGIGIVELILCFLFARAQLRDIVEEQELSPLARSVLDATAILSAAASYGGGVMLADMWRDAQEE